jgi:hypothetical protein
MLSKDHLSLLVGTTGGDGNNAISSGYDDLVAYEHLFLSNPGLPQRIEVDSPLN